MQEGFVRFEPTKHELTQSSDPVCLNFAVRAIEIKVSISSKPYR